MQSFLEDVADDIQKNHPSLQGLVLVLPSKRAGIFLRKYLSERIEKPVFSPAILSIEEFIGQISTLVPITEHNLLFELYRAYSEVVKKDRDDFQTFMGWAPTLLQDFNEVDRYLLDHERLFGYLAEIHRIKNWSPTNENTPLVSGYVKFWKNALPIYIRLTERLKEKHLGYQGLIYKEASKKVGEYMASYHQKHIFIGFNALNTAETKIIRAFLENGNAAIYWDLDTYFLNDPIHDAGLFIRRYKASWRYFEKTPIQGVSNHFLKERPIKITGLPKNIAQAKYVGDLIQKMTAFNGGVLNKTAIVLADESLLTAILHALPNSIDKVNVTMGLPLAQTLLSDFFLALMDLEKDRSHNGWYYKNVLAWLDNPYAEILLELEQKGYVDSIRSSIHSQNLAYLNASHFKKHLKTGPQKNFVSTFFAERPAGLQTFISTCLQLIEKLYAHFNENNSPYELEQLSYFHEIFTDLKQTVLQHDFLTEISVLRQLYSRQVAEKKLDFQGDSTEGLQILGMLESRNLDFETVIVVSVNEGILPSGKKNNSFIPFDVKKEFGLPTHKEKDAIYTYHFYRLLQRAQNIHLLYNTEVDVLEGGEKSRLLTQLLSDNNINHCIAHSIVAPAVAVTPKILLEVHKTKSLLEDLGVLARKGLSPSSLANYIRNPLDFYRKNLLKITDREEVEENIAANTFGTIVHDALEAIYKPFEGCLLDKTALLEAKEGIRPIVHQQFTKFYAADSLKSGQNLLVFNVIVQYLQNLVENDLLHIKSHEIKILGIERELLTTIDIPQLGFPVVLKGKIDRIDMVDGQVRILDYKTGQVNASEVAIVDMVDAVTEPKYNKAFQLLCYGLLYSKTTDPKTLTAGIIPVKKRNPNPVLFAVKPSTDSKQKNHLIHSELLEEFENKLNGLVLELFDPNVPFIEKEV